LFAAEWEAAAKNVPASTRSVIIRTGIVLARDGGVLARMLPIFELFAGQ
jgi:NAD dependent epimerase/dehydratase family enzyme